ncbi:MAG: VOC family protein [Planctomycetota bacterium]|jgi:PhnB protein
MTNPIPAEATGFIPHLVVDDAEAAIEFYVIAFGAKEHHRMATPDGKLMHATLSIDGQTLYVCDDFPEFGGGVERAARKLPASPVTIHRFVVDVDGAFGMAVSSGASVVMEPADMFWGDRYAIVRDPFGHLWSFARRNKDMSPEEQAAAVAAMFQSPPACD